MWKELLLSSAFSLYMIFAVSPASGQEGTSDPQQPATTRIQIGKETLQVKLRGDDLPQYAVVSMFFMQMNNYLQETDSSHRKFLSKIGVAHGTPAEEFLVGITRKAVEIVIAPDTDPSLVGEEYRRHQMEEMKKKATNLAIVFGNLLDGLEESGLDSNRIVQYCENEVRPNVSVSSTEDTFAPYMEAVAEFDKQLAADNGKPVKKGKQQ